MDIFWLSPTILTLLSAQLQIARIRRPPLNFSLVGKRAFLKIMIILFLDVSREYGKNQKPREPKTLY
jgi:hypothetical protein